MECPFNFGHAGVELHSVANLGHCYCNERTQAQVSEAGINIFITQLREQQYQNYTAKFHRLTDHSLQPKKEF